MTSFGAVGQTQDEMLAVLKYPMEMTKEDIARNCKILAENLKESTVLKMGENWRVGSSNKSKNFFPYLATKVFYKMGYTIKPAFSEITKDSFDSEAQAVDFLQSRNAAKIINSWVEAQTNNKIKDLMSPNDFSNDTRLVLVNAIYFLCNWKLPFDPKETRKETFYNSGFFAVNVDMMNTYNDFKYKNLPEWNATAIQLPYKNSDIAMLFILPKSRLGLQFLESNLKNANF